MSLEFLNPVLLFGLAAVGLPVIAHLLSKKRFDVVEWGAMQFLDLGEQHRRRVRIEELLLLLLRLVVVGLVALAIARPTLIGGFWANSLSTENRDVVFILDGSYSMGRTDLPVAPHEQGRAFIQRILNRAQPGDTFALLDAREQVRNVIGRPIREPERARDAVAQIPPPAGSANLPLAVARALEILATTSHARRDVIVLTDGQAWAWRTDDEAIWSRVRELETLPAVEPNLWAATLHLQPPQSQFSLSNIRLSRERAAVGFPVRLSATLTYSGTDQPSECELSLEIDGQRLAESTIQSPLLEPGGEFLAEFEQTFSTAGSHVLSVVIEDDAMPGDNRADAAVTIFAPAEVILVDGQPNLDPTRSETFFALAALQGGEDREAYLRPRVLKPAALNETLLESAATVVLANVTDLTDSQAELIRDFVNRGGGLLVAAGELVNSQKFNDQLSELIPAKLEKWQTTDETPVGISPDDLSVPWPLAAGEIDELTTARFSRYWQVAPAENAEIWARLANGDPWLLSKNRSRGRVSLLTTPLDSDGSTLPTKAVFVSLLHETLFYLSQRQTDSRNLNVGEPLIENVLAPENVVSHELIQPDGTTTQLDMTGDPPMVRWDETSLPGIYQLKETRRERSGATTSETIPFVVNFDRREANLTPLSAADREQSSAADRIKFYDSLDDLQRAFLADDSRTELWQLLLVLAAGLLCLEIWMTRRLVEGGHAVLDATSSAAPRDT